MSEYTTIEDILTGADVVKDDGEFTVKNVLDDFKQAYEGKKRLIDAMQEDYEFALGKQWDPDDVKTLEEAGVRALTINIISPNLQLLRGIESQNRSEFKAFPEGQEDTVSAEIATRLMKNAIKLSDLDYKISEMFDDGKTCGESYLEPWIEYPYNMKDDGTIDLLGRLKFTKQYFDQIYPDPAAREYDLSDADYVCKYTADVSKEKLISMFPDMKDEIEEMNTGKIVVDSVFPERDQQGMDVQKEKRRAQLHAVRAARRGLDGIVERPATDFQLNPVHGYLTVHSWMPAENAAGRTTSTRSAVVLTGVKRTML